MGKVKAHLEEQHLLDGIISPLDFAGNTYADTLAGWAAEEAAVPLDQKNKLAKRDDIAGLILHRLVAVTAWFLDNFPEEERQPRLKMVKPTDLQKLQAA